MTSGWRKRAYEGAARKWIEDWRAIGGRFAIAAEVIDGDDVGFDVRCMTPENLEKAATLVWQALNFPEIHNVTRRIVHAEKLAEAV